MILGIESSCDESAIACFDERNGLSHEIISSQIELHATYGGVVPDLASREHLENFDPLLRQLMERLDLRKLNQVAVTMGPGLAACLAMGLTFAKTIAAVLKIPLVGVNHLQGHAYSPFIPLHQEDPKCFRKKLDQMLPHCGLIVSGGNTIIVEISKDLQITTIAETLDDAAGEAIDKGAKLLGLPYPGGPEVEKLAKNGNPSSYDFPISFPNPDDLKFSFSGLKTSLRYAIEKMSDEALDRDLHDICFAYQNAVVEQLIRKMSHVLDREDYQSIGLSGGVSNNQLLRDRFTDLSERFGIPGLIAERRHTGDNASMIAFAAWLNPDVGVLDTVREPLTFSPSSRVDT